MTLKQLLHIKYNDVVKPSELNGKEIELNTTVYGYIKGIYVYTESDLIILTSVQSERLSKAFPYGNIPANKEFTILPEQIVDITIHL